MRNQKQWKPTKVVQREGHFEVSSDPLSLSISSRLVASLQVRNYEEAIRIHARGRLLDMGCGYVPYYEMYKDRVDQIVCIDWENSLHRNEFVDHVVNLNEPLPIESKSFETVLLTDVLEHVARPLDLMAEISRVLVQGGKVIVGVPFFYWLHERPHDYYRYTEFALDWMCQSNQLSTLSLTPYGGAPEVLSDITGKCIDGLGFSTICRAYVAICKALIASAPLRAISRRTARLFPLGYVLVAIKSTE